jgi:flagellar protein FlgJ
VKIQNGFSLKPLEPGEKRANQEAQLRQAAKMYETHFLNEMVKAMRHTVNREGGLMKPNMAEKIFSEQLDQQYVENWSNRGGVGLSDMIFNQIKERYFGTTGKQFGQGKGALPIAPRKNMPLPDSIQMKMTSPPVDQKSLGYRITVPDASDGYDLQAPFDGTVKSMQALGDGWHSFELDHGLGLKSELTFPGQAAQIAPGTKVEAGEKLGSLEQARPVVAWNLDWMQV